MGKAELPSMAELFFFPYAIRSLALNTELYFHTKFLQMTLLLKRSPVFWQAYNDSHLLIANLPLFVWKKKFCYLRSDLPCYLCLILPVAVSLPAAAAVASVVSDSVRPQGRKPTRLLRPWDSPGKNTGVGCYFLLQCMKVKSEREVAQSCPTLHDPMDYSLPGSSIHGIFQARVLEWGAIAFSGIPP